MFESTANGVGSPSRIPAPVDAKTAEIDALKKRLAEIVEQTNSSFEEVANMILDVQRGCDLLLDRITKYNQKSSHKI